MIEVNDRKFDCVEINGIRYPVDKTTITSQVFFRVVDLHGEERFYLNPEEYYDMSCPRLPRGADGPSQAKWAADRQAFLQKHIAWYDRIDNIKNNIVGWLSASKIDTKGYQIGTQPYVV